jgi:tetratricopeptide (TPR) repeat protein/O-antigen ligase
MADKSIKTVTPENKALSLFDTALFIITLVVLALRTTFTEAPSPQSAPIQAAINDTVYSLSLSGVLIFAFLLRFLVRLFAGRLSFKITPMNVGLVFLLAALIISTFYASNKRSAITSSLTLLAPVLMTFLLAALLDSHAKIKILLIVVISLGVVATWQAAEQYFVSNNIMLEQYKNDPESILQPLGIQPGTLNHMILEHRIFSKDVRASFTTSNSAGSFAILASFAAIALFAELLKIRKTLPRVNILVAAGALAIILFGLFLTQSKGAIAAFFIAVLVFAVLLLTKRPRLSKNIILAGCLIGLLTLVPLLASYGLKHGRLPGGNSMLVRWQYWTASTQMFLDHVLTGVGGGNFTASYRLYKSPAAIETISDPHCFVLSLLTQFGILGLIGFLIFVLAPLCRASFACPEQSRRADPSHLETLPANRFSKLAFAGAIAPIALMMLLRPFLLPPSAAAGFVEKLYVFFTDYMAPAAAFLVAYAILAKALQTSNIKEYALQTTSITSIALFSALLGVLIHNLIDFAIFEPGVLAAFCAILACLIALYSEKREQLNPAPVLLKIFAPAVALIIVFAYFNYAIIPIARNAALIAQAGQPLSLGQFNLAHNLLDTATKVDPLNPEAPLMNGRLYLQHFSSPVMPRQQTLELAEQALFIAAQRNPADSRIFDSLTQCYYLRSQLLPEQKELWLNSALDSAQTAVSLSPGDAELHLLLAQIAEDLGKKDLALKHYQKTVEIEDSFRELFRQMYPGREVFSRLGNDKYSLAKQRIKDLIK